MSRNGAKDESSTGQFMGARVPRERPPVHARVKRKKGSGRKKEEARKKERVSGKRVKEGSEHASGQRPCELFTNNIEKFIIA